MKKKELSISLLRFISMSMIVVCHILQFYGNELAYWFNVGVQIFLIISGYLYGQKRLINPIEFYKKNFKKILCDYWICLIVVLLFYQLYTPQYINLENVIKAFLGVSNGIPGLGHYWFISTILICYLVTPILSKYLNGKKDIVNFLFIICFNELVFHFLPYFDGAWINCYCVGFYYARMKESIKNDKLFIANVCSITILANSIKIFLKYIVVWKSSGLVTFLILRFYSYAHVLLGFFLFLVGKKFLPKIQRSRVIEELAEFGDKFSYDIYLVHQVFILGPFSVLNKMKWGGTLCYFNFDSIRDWLIL